MKSVVLVCFALVLIGVGLSVTSLATPYWLHWNYNDGFNYSSRGHHGLWKFCENGYCWTYSARDIPYFPGAVS